jgi:hypothetical protein
MKRTIPIIIAALGCALIGLADIGVAAAQAPAGASKSALAARAQAPARSTRPRTRIRVTPGYYPYRTFSTDYPVPYQAEYPGPGFVRECASRLVPEARASGPVIVPRMRCWWQPGVSDLKSYP